MAGPNDGTRVVAANLAELRRDREWTLDDLAARMDAVGYPMARSTINKIENNIRDGRQVERRKVTIDDVLALARAFDVPPERLLLGEGDELIRLIDRWAAATNEANSKSFRALNAEVDLQAAQAALAAAEAEVAEARARADELAELVRARVAGPTVSLDEVEHQIEIRYSPQHAEALRAIVREATS